MVTATKKEAVTITYSTLSTAGLTAGHAWTEPMRGAERAGHDQ
jgi:hypothetical protein